MVIGKRAHSQLKPLVAASPQSKVEAYHFVRENLKEVGWAVRNPSHYSEGQVWMQNQCFEHPVLKSALKLMCLENIVKFSETRIRVIETKSRKTVLGQAFKGARNDYAAPINKDRDIKAVPISDVVGNDEFGYEVHTKIFTRGRCENVTINDVEATGLLNPRIVETLFISDSPDIADYQVSGELLLRAAEQISATLHNDGINKSNRS